MFHHSLMLLGMVIRSKEKPLGVRLILIMKDFEVSNQLFKKPIIVEAVEFRDDVNTGMAILLSFTQ